MILNCTVPLRCGTVKGKQETRMWAELFSVFYQFADVFAFLILSAAGLAIVFGMMGVINMAHGEFIMCGAYVTVGLVKLGVPLAIAQALATLTAEIGRAHV